MMFDKSVFKSGRHSLFPDIDYSAVRRADIYYKNILCKNENILPEFCATIDVKAALETAQAEKEFELNEIERNFVRFRRLISRQNTSKHHELLTKMDGYLLAYPNDSNLKVMCAKALLQRELYSDAARLLHRAIFNNPENAMAHALLGLLAALANDHGTSIRCAREALRNGLHLYHTQSKALVFTLLAMGSTVRVGPFDPGNLLSGSASNYKALQNHVILSQPTKLAHKPIILIACDEKYFNDFAKSLLASLIPCSGEVVCHIHIIGKCDGLGEWMARFRTQFNEQLILSTEQPNNPALLHNKSYLASNRFINLPEFMERFERPYAVVDADSILINPSALQSLMKDQERSVLYFAKTGPIWDRISAPFLFHPNNSFGIAFARKCADYLIEKFHGPKASSFWYIDQLALLGAFIQFSNDVDLCPAELLTDVNCHDDAIFWTLSNDKKHPKYVQKAAELRTKYPI